MNMTTGIFTAPETGHYMFTFTGLAYFSTTSGHLGIVLMHNDANICMSWAERGATYETYSLQSTLNLKLGDRVWLKITHMNNANLHDNVNHFTHFTGQLL